MSDGSSGSGINSVIEAEFRARELGAQKSPDPADERAELMAGRVTLGLGVIAVIGATWLFFGLGAASIVTAGIAVTVLITWSIAARRRRPEPGPPTT